MFYNFNCLIACCVNSPGSCVFFCSCFSFGFVLLWDFVFKQSFRHMERIDDRYCMCSRWRQMRNREKYYWSNKNRSRQYGIQYCAGTNGLFPSKQITALIMYRKWSRKCVISQFLFYWSKKEFKTFSINIKHWIH